MISAKKRAKKINDQTENDEKNQITITACYAAEKTLIKQRRLNTTETKSENITVNDTADEKSFVITSNEAVKKINVVSTASNAANEKNVNVATVFDAISEKKQILLTNLL